MSDVIEQGWSVLREYTPARIGIGRVGGSQPTRANLQFQHDHARARDAVLEPLDSAGLQVALEALGVPVVWAESQAGDRRAYLQRPDLGRLLQEASAVALRALVEAGTTGFDIAVVIGDGLSSRAVMRHATPLLQQLLPMLTPWKLAPVCVAQQARVALADDVGQALKAKLTLMLIGERPGLSAADSLGLYLTWGPTRGKVDSERNCISNIRPEGLDYATAARICFYLVNGAFQRQCSGVELKDQSQTIDNHRDQRIPFLR